MWCTCVGRCGDVQSGAEQSDSLVLAPQCGHLAVVLCGEQAECWCASALLTFWSLANMSSGLWPAARRALNWRLTRALCSSA